jgi:flagella basal body P-ring formation protein FlgA
MTMSPGASCRRAGRALTRALAAAGLCLAAPAAAGPDWAPPGWSPGGPATAAAASAGTVVVAARALSSGDLITRGDVRLAQIPDAGGVSDLDAVLGQEARVTLYAGRPIRPGDIGPPTLVERNELVLLRYRRGPLLITAEGRALGQGSVGDRIRAMNMTSRQPVTGVVAPDGAVEVSP